MKPEELVSRWGSSPLREVAGEVLRRLVTGEALRSIGLGEIDGRVDLRGLSFTSPRSAGALSLADHHFVVFDRLVELRAFCWEGLDFSFAHMPSLRLFDGVISDCRYDRAVCEDWRMWGMKVLDSTFARADLRDSAIGTWEGGRRNDWSGVVFDRADLRGAFIVAAAFHTCSFRSTRLDKVQFQQCEMEECVFGGPLKGVRFDSRDLPDRPQAGALRRVDLTGADLRDVEFRGCRFDEVKFADDPALRLVPGFPAVARRQLAIVRHDGSREARMLTGRLENALKFPGREDSVGVFNRNDFLRSGGEAYAELAEATLLQAMA